MTQKLNMIAAMEMVELQAARRRDYQTANIAKATAEYIAVLEKEIADLKAAQENKQQDETDAERDDEVRHASGNGHDNGAQP